MSLQDGLSDISIPAVFIPGDKTHFPYLWYEVGWLQGSGPVEKQVSLTSWRYYHLWGGCFALKSRPDGTGLDLPSLDSIVPFRE